MTPANTASLRTLSPLMEVVLSSQSQPVSTPKSAVGEPRVRCTHEHPFAKVARQLNAEAAARMEAVRPGYTPGEVSRELIQRGSK